MLLLRFSIPLLFTDVAGAAAPALEPSFDLAILQPPSGEHAGLAGFH